MDLSDSLSRVVRKILRFNCISCTVFIHSHIDHYIAVINADDYKGGGSSRNKIEAFIKALAELGEDIIAKKNSMPCRSGLAGGLFLKTAIQRAKEELLERDSFFYHYRTQIPFLKIEENETLYMVQLCSALPEVYIAMVFNKDYFNGTYFKFGMGSSKNYDTAIKKAISEYHVLDANHKIFPNWFKNSNSTIDLHHQASIDSKNIQKIKNLMVPTKNFNRKSIINRKWIIKRMESPNIFFKYALVEHPDLIKIKFGEKESDGVLHPFW